MDALLKKQLEIAATKVRMGVIEGVHAAKAGHPADPFPLLTHSLIFTCTA